MRYADSTLRATCSRCGTDCGVLESRTQATRSEPSRSLGFFAFCPECEVTFPAPEPQPTLEEPNHGDVHPVTGDTWHSEEGWV